MCNRIEVGDVVECITGAFRDFEVGQTFKVLSREVTPDNDTINVESYPSSVWSAGVGGFRGTFNIEYFRLKHHAPNKEIKVGDVVVCHDDFQLTSMRVGDIRTVEEINHADRTLKFKGNIWYNAGRFKLQDPVHTTAESSEPEVVKPIVEVGDIIECVDNSTEIGCMGKMLIVGGMYTVSRVLNKQGSHIEVEGIKGESFGLVRFKLHKSKEAVRNNTKIENKVEDHSLMIKGAIVECINNSTDNGIHGDKLEVGKTYVVSRRVTSNGRHIEVEGIEGEPYCSDRFKVVMTNRKIKPTPKVTVRQLEAFRKMVTFNQIIVDEGIYFDEDSQSWLSRKQSDGWWVNYIRGAWVTFLEFEKMALNKSISDWVEGK